MELVLASRESRGVDTDDRDYLFVQAYFANGFVGKDAAITVGFPPKSAAQAASRLLLKATVQEMIREGMSSLMMKHTVRLDDVVMGIKKLAFSNLQNYMGVTSDGQPYVDFSKLTEEQWFALGEVTVDEYTEGRGEDAREVKRTKIKLHDKLAALDKLLRFCGGYNGKEAPVNNYIDNRSVTVNVSADDAAKSYQQFLGRG